MSIASELTKLIATLAMCYVKCNSKGATMPVQENMDNLPDCIDSITGGGSTLITKNINQNGTYNASSDDADGYSQVIVDVPSGSKFVSGNTSEDVACTDENAYIISENFTKVGSPNIDPFYIASGFSDSNYLTIHNPIVFSANSFTMHFKFFVTSTSVSNAGLLDGDYDLNNQNHAYRFTITNAGRLYFRAARYGGQTYQLELLGTTVLSVNTIYYTKVEYDNVNGYKLYLSTDNRNWNLEANSSEIFKPSYLTSSFIFKIGDNTATGYSFQGSIYLEDAYIDVNGSRAWEAVTKVSI